MKIVLITGANKGIGFETARQLAERGCFVYIGSRDAAKGRDATEKLRAAGLPDVALLQLDVTDAGSLRAARRVLETRDGRLDVLINNAGISGRQPQTMSAGDLDNLRDVFDTNFFGAVRTTQEFLPLLKKSSAPQIVNVSSNLASLTKQSRAQNPNGAQYAAYSCSKTALNAFTVLLANELSELNFTINAVAPGYTATALNNFQGTQDVEAAAKTIADVVASNEGGATGTYRGKEGEIPW